MDKMVPLFTGSWGPTQGHASTSNYSSFGLPFQHQTGEVGYHSASSYQSRSDHSRSSSPSEPSTSSNGNDRTQCGKEKKMWLKEEVILIETYLKEKRWSKNPRVRNKDIWSVICLEMWEQGHISCGAKSWETKFKNLKRSYIAYIDHNKKTGRNAKKCAYYEELHNIFHGDDDITPSAVYSSRKGLVKHP